MSRNQSTIITAEYIHFANCNPSSPTPFLTIRSYSSPVNEMSRKKNSQYLKGAFCQIYIRPCSFGQSSAAVNAKNVRPSKLYLGVYVLLDWHILVAWCTSLPYICMQQLSWVRCVPQSFPQNTDRAEEDGIVVQDHFWSSSPNPWRSYWAFLHGNKQSSPSRHREFGKSPWSVVPEIWNILLFQDSKEQ